jgi:hypothetical protein
MRAMLCGDNSNGAGNPAACEHSPARQATRPSSIFTRFFQ